MFCVRELPVNAQAYPTCGIGAVWINEAHPPFQCSTVR